MVLIQLEDLGDHYEDIKKASLAGGCSVLIFVANDTDAICTSRILTTMLRTDNVVYKVKPVNGYSQLQAAHAELVVDNEALRTVIMLNCGGLWDLSAKFPLPALARLYLLDVHKPVHHNNVRAEDTIFVCNDRSGLRVKDVPSDEDLKTRELEEESVGEEDSDDFDSEPDSYGSLADGGHSPGARKRAGRGTRGDRGGQRRRIEDAGSLIGEGDGFEDTTGVRDSSKVVDVLAAGVSTEISDKRRRRAENYYAGHFHGTPSAMIAYAWAESAGKSRNDLLWLSIVGTTSWYVQEKLATAAYRELASELHEWVSFRNGKDDRDLVGDDGSRLAVADTHGHITMEEEYRFLLYRHWSLFESMYHSHYVASQLRVWGDGGVDRLETFLARVGIPKEAYSQEFAYMESRMKRRLHSRLREAATDMPPFPDAVLLKDCLFASFSLKLGYQSPFSAADFAVAANCLLECSAPESESAGDSTGGTSGGDGSPGAGKHRAAAGSGSAEAAGAGAGAAAAADTSWLDNFNRAYDCLANMSPELCADGIKRAMALQRAVVRQGTSMMEKAIITNTGPFRYVFLNNLSGIDADFFTQPMALAKLGRFVTDAYQSQGKWLRHHAKPLLLCALNDRTEYYLVVGQHCEAQRGDKTTTQFMRSFDEAARRAHAHYRMESFEESVMEIKQLEAQLFIEKLHEFLVGDDEDDDDDSVGLT